MIVEMFVEAIYYDLTTNTPVIVLRDEGRKKILPIWIGNFEANAIELALENKATPRPLTHDLLTSILEILGAKVDKITVVDMQNDTFIASISLINKNGNLIEVDARPSDAIAIALRNNAKIYAADNILKDASSFEEEGDKDPEKKAFKDFLDNIKPDDFKYKH